MTNLTITPTETAWVLGGATPPAWRLGVWAGAGATLWWDVAEPGTRFGAVVWEVSRASAWLGEVHGPHVSEALREAAAHGRTGRRSVETVPGRLAAAARDAALAQWRQDWWPASRLRLIPPLDPRLVAAELAESLGRLGDANADPDAAEDARAVVAQAEERLGATTATPLIAAPEPEPAPEPGGILSGAMTLDLARVPPGVVDATGEARWRVSMRMTGAVISVEILAAPGFADEPPAEVDLRVSVAEVEASLRLRGDVWAARHPVPPEMLASPPVDRAVALSVPGYERSPAPIPSGELIRVARERLIAPASLSEHDAAGREILHP